VRWLLPWMSVLLVSVSLASATNAAVTGSWQAMDRRSERSRAAVGDLAPSGAAGNTDDARVVDVACISRVAAYSASLSDAVRRCSTWGVSSGAGGAEQMAAMDIFPARDTPHASSVKSGIDEDTNRTLPPATAAVADGDDVRARFLASRPELASTATPEP
jgi:hypothetical protein